MIHKLNQNIHVFDRSLKHVNNHVQLLPKQEIEESIHYAKATDEWSAYINGMQLNCDEFTKEIDSVCAHIR